MLRVNYLFRYNHVGLRRVFNEKPSVNKVAEMICSSVYEGANGVNS